MKGVLVNNSIIPQSINPDLSVTLPGFLRAQPGSVLLSVKLQPRASKNEIGDPIGDELKIKVTAPPVDAAANEALIKLLSEKFDCARSRIEIVRGHKSRHKTVKLHGFATKEVLWKIFGGASSASP